MNTQTPKATHTAGFTPGPWWVVPCPSPDYVRVANSTGKLTIVTVSVPDSIPLETRDANARLIAAAPAMAEALCNLLKMVEDGDVTTNELDAARAALKLAGLI